MKIKSLLWLFLVMLAGISQFASAALLDDFESYSTGKVFEKASPPWYAIFSTTGNALIAEETGGNNYGKIWGAGNGARGMCRPLDTLNIPNANTASTLYLRVRAEGTNEDASFGLSDDTASSSLSWGNFEVQIAFVQGKLKARNAGTVVDLMSITSGVWYDVWAVIDNSADTYDVYAAVEGNTPELLATDFVFRNSGAGAVAADLITFHSYNNTNGTAIWMDDISIADGVAPELLTMPSSPAPNNGETGVDVYTSTLSWKGGLDPANPSQLDPNIVKYYVWTSEDNVSATDANMILQDIQTITSWTDPSASYALGVPLQYERTYYWLIEQAINTGSGNAGDPNNILGPVWTFTTAAAVPEFNPAYPQDVKVFGTDLNAVFEARFSSVTVPTVKWYKTGSGTPLTAAQVGAGTQVSGDYTVTVTDLGGAQYTSQLEVVNLSDKEGSYTCEVVNSTMTPYNSPTADLYLKKKLAWYQFEQNANDSVGTSHGTEVNGMIYTDQNVQVKTDGQLYAADPNGTNFITIPKETVYPRAGENNGLDQGTIACWVKCDPGQGGHIMTQYTGVPGTYTTAIQFYVDSTNNRFTFQVRDEETDQVNLQGADVDDGEWHYVVGTIDGTTVTLYIDVVNVVSGTDPDLGNYVAWEYDMPIMGIAPRAPAGGSFKGVLDDLIIYNYAMTQHEIAQTYFNVTNKRSCIEAYNDVYDFNGNCIVDLADFAMLASHWLSNGLYPGN